MTLTIGTKYVVKHQGVLKTMTFQGELVRGTASLGSLLRGTSRARRHFMFRNDATGRDIEIKSLVKVKGEWIGATAGRPMFTPLKEFGAASVS